MASVGYALEDLRKQARHLENEIDLKLVSFSKLGTSLGSKDAKHESGPDAVPLLGGSASDHVFETMALEVEQLLAKLSEVNDQMASQWQGAGTAAAPGGTTVLHTLQRHRDILQDYVHEFQKTRTNIRARRERDQLLGSVRRDIDTYKNSSSLSRRSEGYLKEHEHLRNSERLVHDQINANERRTQEPANDVEGDPDKDDDACHLVQRINLRKRRDSIILGAVIGVCLVVLMLYIAQ